MKNAAKALMVTLVKLGAVFTFLTGLGNFAYQVNRRGFRVAPYTTKKLKSL